MRQKAKAKAKVIGLASGLVRSAWMPTSGGWMGFITRAATSPSARSPTTSAADPPRDGKRARSFMTVNGHRSRGGALKRRRGVMTVFWVIGAVAGAPKAWMTTAAVAAQVRPGSGTHIIR